MKKFSVFFAGMTLLIISSPLFSKVTELKTPTINSIELRVINSLREEAFIDVCTGPVERDKKTACSDIQPIKKGNNRIFIPPYAKAYPVITGSDEIAYTCGTEEKPLDQMFFSSSAIKNNTLVLDSYILDKDQKRLAVLCILQQDQQGLAQF